MAKHYLFFTQKTLPQPNVASLVQVVHSANAAANLGYQTVLAYMSPQKSTFNPIGLMRPFNPQKPDPQLIQQYNIQEHLKVSPLPMPWPVNAKWGGKWTNSSTVVSKYYLPVHIKPYTKIVHTRDWNFAKAAIKHRLPVIYEQHHYDQKKFPPEIVRSPWFQIAVTVADTVKDNLIANGMPPEKTIKLHNGFNHLFICRHEQEAEEWRQKLIPNERKHLVVYSGGLYPFKGVDMLIDVAKKLPKIQFAFAGGNESQVLEYQQKAKDNQVDNAVFLGFLPQEQLASLLQAADVLAHPHLMTEAATFTSPLKFFDYLASGTPIAASEIPPLREFKSSNIAVGWCEPDHPTLFAECIEQVLSTYPRKTGGYPETIEFATQFSCENRITKILSYVDESMRPELVN
ncbi:MULTISPECIES: glycosyltransferase [Arthrospira]|jgi:glycosyltransferase involved in cell wall biosynthesis|uniref:Glycosyl transferase n=1 Tax=Limnospira platensis NIES-46 TaxID=1236695 RepID=A0A5M3TAA4_LIMPL|nr:MULTISPECIES: glycosyltransferase [Arthrospira]AMW30450.1 glycosyl transferase family 1 [Arthrospira platensis YZ]KDR59066.1 glycosyl transferase family 1 [Arthrospira platensis str. Paraca]MBD2710812.1 glycosyltransferase [Arthrospira platensis FACHB-835]MDF2207606.1 glycosyltransferase [Arthrospira platensis NCB002]MDT9295313.1 glycosyltransferase [Arthrospira platensis PCC 7345]MDT9311070.1 glycosyltransferase [Limnospira sp. Paracas R14]QQW28397.1 glycosyltransferase [Arthrospira sp. 